MTIVSLLPAAWTIVAGIGGSQVRILDAGMARGGNPAGAIRHAT